MKDEGHMRARYKHRRMDESKLESERDSGFSGVLEKMFTIEARFYDQ